MSVGASTLAPLLMRHLGSYLELGAAAATEYRRALTRRLCALALAVGAALAGFGAMWVAGLIAFWDSPWRLTYAVASGLLLLLLAVVSLWGAMSSGPTGPFADALKGEMQKDLELFRQWKSTL